MHEAGKVEDNGHVGTLTCERGSGATGKNGGSGGAAGGERGFHVCGVAGIDDADGKLAVIGSVGREHGAGGEIEVDFAFQRGPEPGFELAMGGEALVLKRRELRKDGKNGRAHGAMVARLREWPGNGMR